MSVPKQCLTRLKKEYMALQKDPPDFIQAAPLETNYLEWHYVITGPPQSPYEGGLYHGIVRFTNEYPFKPPSILMLTPSGRFQTNTRLCLSMSDYHPESWSCMWSVSSILQGLLSFMLENQPTLGSISTSDDDKKKLALTSLDFNLNDRNFRELFPQYCAPDYKLKQQELRQRKAAASSSSSAVPTSAPAPAPVSASQPQQPQPQKAAAPSSAPNEKKPDLPQTQSNWSTAIQAVVCVSVLWLIIKNL